MAHVAGDGAANLDRGAFATRRSAGKVRGDGAEEGEEGHARMDEAAGEGAVDNQVVAATGLQAARAVEPRGGEQYGWQQGEQGAMLLARAAHKVERCQKRPCGGTHGA